MMINDDDQMFLLSSKYTININKSGWMTCCPLLEKLVCITYVAQTIRHNRAIECFSSCSFHLQQRQSTNWWLWQQLKNICLMVPNAPLSSKNLWRAINKYNTFKNCPNFIRTKCKSRNFSRKTSKTEKSGKSGWIWVPTNTFMYMNVTNMNLKNAIGKLI